MGDPGRLAPRGFGLRARGKGARQRRGGPERAGVGLPLSPGPQAAGHQGGDPGALGRGPRLSPGLVFCAPKNGPDEAGPDGCLIPDNEGQPVWFRPLLKEDRDVMDFKLQRRRGCPVLTWWEGVHTGYGQGEYVLMDETYREVGRVRAGNGYEGDHHEFVISPQGTALFDIYGWVPMDLSPYGGVAWIYLPWGTPERLGGAS